MISLCHFLLKKVILSFFHLIDFIHCILPHYPKNIYCFLPKSDYFHGMKRQYWIYHSVIITLILGSLLPFLAAFPSTISTLSPTSFGDKILICTVDGYQWIDKDDWDKGKIPAPSNHIKCPVCVLTAFGSTLLPAPSLPTITVVFDTNDISYSVVDSVDFIRTDFLLSPPSHAPPTILL